MGMGLRNIVKLTKNITKVAASVSQNVTGQMVRKGDRDYMILGSVISGLCPASPRSVLTILAQTDELVHFQDLTDSIESLIKV